MHDDSSIRIRVIVATMCTIIIGVIDRICIRLMLCIVVVVDVVDDGDVVVDVLDAFRLLKIMIAMIRSIQSTSSNNRIIDHQSHSGPSAKCPRTSSAVAN